MRSRAGLDRVCEFSKSILLGCVLLLLASRISALTENETTENHELKKPLEGISEMEDLINDSIALDADRYAARSSDLRSRYVLTQARLRKIRSKLMYWFFDKGGYNDSGDYQKDIHTSMPQIHKNFDFQLPFFGSRFNYTRVSMNGYLEFSDPPEHYTYPLVFPVKDWPKKNDPSFIGIFFSKCRIGEVKEDDIDQRSPGVYFRLEEGLQRRIDQFGVEFRERLKWDIREAIVGSDSFEPKHAIVVTWKNMSFAGGIDNSLYKTNTFQMVLATDEVSTYAMFNYLDIQWTSHTEAGGDTVGGEGGVPAYIGFNAGNGTESYEYKPYSQMPKIRDLTRTGGANGFPGRHVFKIDRDITLGTCNNLVAAKLAMKLAPAGGNKLGGTIVNITGPCFNRTEKIRCKFDNVWVNGTVIDRSRAICVQPFVEAYGSIDFAIRIGEDKPYTLEGKYSIDYPITGKPVTTPPDTWSPTTWRPYTTPSYTWRPDTTPPNTWRPDTTSPDTTPPNTWRPDTTSPGTWPPTTWRPDTTPSNTWPPTTWRPDTTPSNTWPPTTWRPDTTSPDTWLTTTWRPNTTPPATVPPTTWRPDTTPDTLPPTTWRPDATTPDTWPSTTERPTPPSVGPIREHEHVEIKITWDRYKYT